MTATFQLKRDPFGKLVLTNAEGEEFVGVAPVLSIGPYTGKPSSNTPTRRLRLAEVIETGSKW